MNRVSWNWDTFEDMSEIKIIVRAKRGQKSVTAHIQGYRIQLHASDAPQYSDSRIVTVGGIAIHIPAGYGYVIDRGPVDKEGDHGRKNTRIMP